MTDLTTEPAAPAAAAPGRDSRLGRIGDRLHDLKPWQLRSAEFVVSIGASLLFLRLCMHISVNPLQRIGQVSGLAKVQQYGALVGLPLLAVLLYTAYRGSLRRHQLVQRLVCAAVAGLATGAVAGGIAVALHGTPFGLGGQEGDPGNVMGMANNMMTGHKLLPGVYPPLFPAALAAVAKVFHHGVSGVGYAMKDLQLVVTAVAGPATYLAWRLLLRPFWAVLLAAPAAILFMDPIRPYSHITMLVMIPVLAGCLRELHRASTLSTRSLLLRAAGFGASFGILFLWYSGWFIWAAPGVMLLAVFLVPWRGGRARLRPALTYLGVTLLAAGVVGSPLLYQMVRLGATTKDRYAYVMTYIDPAYVMGWVSDREGHANYHVYPQTGELAGQSAFTLLLLAAVGLALALGLRNVAVRTAAAALISSWLLRFWFASHMQHDQAVQLYPRTTWIIMYTLIILAVFGLMMASQRSVGWLRGVGEAVRPARAITPQAVARGVAGAVCALALFATMGASWSANRYMPTTEAGVEDMGLDALRAHHIKQQNGTCPKYAGGDCSDINMELAEYTFGPDDLRIFCGNADKEQWPLQCGRNRPW
ncbi:hypothetical protein [Kitasatospora sp. NRRL B-11411]|uniref:hypothetical protein n=1 Tax=Kitasatospora sp. NRRL B-11411 TaxID=1463822 RepID=UPI0004C3DE09|nr:hypothetical protein [Kitasatospora sp. NRRL B-11411]